MPPRRTRRSVDPEESRERASDPSGATNDEQNESESLTIEQTNALRAKLGLAPLRASASTRRTVVDADAARRDAAEAAHAAQLAEKIAESKARREAERALRATARLGDGDADGAGDDLGAWLTKSKGVMVDKARELERAKAAKVAAMFAARDEDAEASESDEGERDESKKRSAYTSKDLRGLKVRHTADEIAEGQETVLTLKDSSVLDDDAEDELENVLMAERAARKKARKEATKKSDDPFGEGEDKDKTVLGKYDAKEDAAAMELDGDGGVDAEEEKRKAEIKARLAAELSGIKGKLESAEVVKGQQADFHTQEEMQAKFVKREKKKKMRKKLRTKHIDAAELEQDALAPESKDHGSRRSRGERNIQAENETNEKDSKFASALQKAREVTDKKILAELAGEAEEDEDEELARALARSRKIASRHAMTIPEDIVAQVASRRVADAAKARETAPADESLVFTDMSEFVQGISTVDEDDEPIEDDEKMPDVPPPPPMDGEEEMPDVPPPPPEDEDEDLRVPSDDEDGKSAAKDEPVLAEKYVAQKGLASTLALLKEKAQLDDAQNTRWSGRANDLKDRFDKKNVLEALAADDAPTNEEYKFGFRLDKFDEFGRKLTPKEAFRELCHRFHGIEPGRMKREKRLKQYQEEQKRLQATSVMDERIKATQREQATPYVVLSGQVRAGQSKQADAMSIKQREEVAKSSASPAPTPTPTRAPIDAKSVKDANAGKVSFSMKSTKK